MQLQSKFHNITLFFTCWEGSSNVIFP
uniref:Uncharacterized protein n=1 Tax=Rhizophora mucronata TaxID=61149 RepID=A0A2P2NT59_RHIMU